MSFNWPEIPFTGAEVEAFVNAYKGLAEYIYDEFENYSDSLEIKSPYTNKEVIKELLQAGLVYSSFIIQQRSGSSGPGTDYELGNSPHRPPLTEDQKKKILKDLGCIFDPDDMKDSWKKNGNPGDPPKPGDSNDPLGDPADDDWGNGNGDPKDQKDPSVCPPGSECSGNGQGGCPEGKICRNCRCVPEDCPTNPCQLTPNELRLLTAYAGIGFGSLRDAKRDLLTRYLTCNSNQFTENDLSGGQLNTIKDEVQNKLLSGKITKNVTKVEVTDFLSEEQKTLWGMQPGQRVFQVGSYTPNFAITTLLGTASYITDSTGKILKGVRDDFDFMYGYERSGRWSRSNTGSLSMPGSLPLPSRVSGSMYNKCTVEQLLDNFGKGGDCDVTDKGEPVFTWAANTGRKLVIEAYRCNRGTPVPIWINYN